jgi:hypothetical protein
MLLAELGRWTAIPHLDRLRRSQGGVPARQISYAFEKAIPSCGEGPSRVLADLNRRPLLGGYIGRTG